MSKIFQDGCSPHKNREPKTRQLYLEVYSGVRNILFQNKEFAGGTLGLLIGIGSAFSRVRYEKDDALRMFSGVYAKNESIHPSWQDAFMDHINASTHMAVNYLFPTHNENYSKKSLQTRTETLTTPGAWTVQFCASNDAHFYKSFTLFMEHAIMKEGWNTTGFTYTLKYSKLFFLTCIFYLKVIL